MRAQTIALPKASRSPEIVHALGTFGPHSVRPWSPGLRYVAAVSSAAGSSARLPPAFPAALRHSLAEAGEEGFAVVPAGPWLLLAANGSAGLANGLYALRRAECAGRALHAGVHRPAVACRDVYQFQSPWRLRGLSVDSLRFEEWTEHLDSLRRWGANRLYIDFWCSQYYHPAVPETHQNRPFYEHIRRVLDYAHRIGLRTGVYLFPCHVPTSLYERHPEAHAVEAQNYHGINLCWSRARRHIEPFDRYIFEFFGDSLDDAVIELQDPGSCLCRECCNRFPEIVLEMMALYRSWMGPDRTRRLDLCTLHFRDWIEEGSPSASRVHHPVTGLRRRVFAALPPGTVIVDIDADTIELAHRFGLPTSHFFFDLDPESGLPDQTVFPRPKLARIPEQIGQSLRRGDIGLVDYRMTPRSQFIADALFLRLCWDPALPVRTALADLGAELGLGPAHRRTFADATLALEAFWQTGLRAHVARSAKAFAALPPRHEKLTRMADLTDVLSRIAAYRAARGARVTRADFYPDATFVEQVYQRMRRAPIFNAFTIDQHWELRAREIVGQHLRWWLRALPAG